jgi:lipopolysaccharide/colanic/teichoic acid biosynthesis glycosyltransferase/glycosyltransferase involved in cell wall biosynthesis
MTIIGALFILLVVLAIYHHIGYSLVLRAVKRIKAPFKTHTSLTKGYPRIGVMMCAYNEERHIEEKLNNLGALLYPSDRYEIHVYLDGCTDQTNHYGQATKRRLSELGVTCHIHEHQQNKGKSHAINALIEIGKQEYDMLVFTDVSALLSIDALNQLAMQFENDDVVVATGRYTLDEQSSEQQKSYWAYQNSLKQLESHFGAVIGVPGALFAVRTNQVKPLPENTINDDFVLAMQACQNGGRAVLNDDVTIYERECDEINQDIKRRERIGAGNWQQLIMLLPLLNPKFGWTAFNFFSHKALRALMPIIVCLIYLLAVLDVFQNQSIWAICVCMALLFVHLIGLLKLDARVLKVINKVHYALTCYWVALVGIVKFLAGAYKKPWTRVNVRKPNKNHVAPIKRTIDIVGATVGLILLSPIMVMAALAIKLDSKGPVLYKQLRVGQSSDDFVSLFYVYKFRSMFVDAEAKSGAVWASKNDPRITKVGNFLRKTRIDELPQFWNVLVGEMSIIGPRPERPVFYAKLDKSIPYFGWRTYGLKPGISGLAQVMNGYDESIEDVKSKIGWDYAYALSMSNQKSWLAMEWMILLRTIAVVFTGKGQ